MPYYPPAGGGSSPGGASGQYQYNNGGSLGGANLNETDANTHEFYNGTNGQTVRTYRTRTSSAGFEALELTVDPGGNTGTFGIGSVVGASSGTVRPLLFYGSDARFYTNNSFSAHARVSVQDLNIAGGLLYNIQSGAAFIYQIADNNGSVSNGWINYGGQARVAADFTVTASTALTNVTGLSVNVVAGRTYTFEAVLLCTDAAAGGVQAAISGTATATNIIYEGYAIDSNTIKAQTQATALATPVASTTTTGTTPSIRIQGTITVNAAGTLTVQFAQNTSNATASTVKRGSHFIVQDMP